MKKSLKLISVLLILILTLGILAACGAKADPANAAYVTVSNAGEIAKDKSGNYVAATAVEIPADGSTVGDVITELHKAYATGGEGDYETANSEYGPMITKLWGVENGGSYGYFVNGVMAMSLDDAVKPGDTVDLMIYKDAAGFSDAYIVLSASASGTEVTAKVEAMGYDENWTPVMNPLAGAKIYYVDGKNLKDTGATTGEDGTATFTLKAGTYRIVAVVEGDTPYSASAVKLVVSK